MYVFFLFFFRLVNWSCVIFLFRAKRKFSSRTFVLCRSYPKLACMCVGFVVFSYTAVRRRGYSPIPRVGDVRPYSTLLRRLRQVEYPVNIKQAGSENPNTCIYTSIHSIWSIG